MCIIGKSVKVGLGWLGFLVKAIEAQTIWHRQEASPAFPEKKNHTGCHRVLARGQGDGTREALLCGVSCPSASGIFLRPNNWKVAA